jgi:LacI family repressor for deo operon, udp, cdd, tsx, nupC, and nupG
MTTKIRSMQDFAAAIGISRPTVSKYFDAPDSVRPSTRRRIEEALLQFDYRPNIFAVNQNKRNPKNIGILVPYISDPFYAEVVRQLEIQALKAGYWAIVLSSHGEHELERNAIQTLLSLKLSGAIVAPLGFESDEQLLRNLSQSAALVFLDSRSDAGVPFVGTDNRQSIGLLVEYLARSGEAPVYLDMPAVNHNATERRAAYVESMEALGLEPRVIASPNSGWDFERIGFDQASAQFSAGGFPSSTVLCANDRLAFGVIAAAYQRGIEVGRGPGAVLRVAGHDDHPLSRYTCPPLTTVAQDVSAMAEASLALLLTLMDGSDRQDAPEKKRFDAKLIMRASA